MLNYLIHSYNPSLPPARYIDIPATGPVRAIIIFIPGTHTDDIKTHLDNLRQALAGQVEVNIAIEHETLDGPTATIVATNGSYNREWFAGLVRGAVPFAFTGIAEARSEHTILGSFTIVQTATITVTEGTINPEVELNPHDYVAMNWRYFANLVAECTTPGIVVQASITEDHQKITLTFNNMLKLSLEHVSMAVWNVCDMLRLDCRLPVIGHTKHIEH